MSGHLFFRTAGLLARSYDAALEARGPEETKPQPLTQTTCRSSATTSTRSVWAAITASIGL